MNLPVTNTVDVINGEPIETVDYLGISLLTQGSSVPAHIPPGGTNARPPSSHPRSGRARSALPDGTFSGQHPAGERRGRSRRAPAQVAAAALSALRRLAGTTFRAAGRGPSLLARAKVGTRVTYSLSRPTPVTFKVQRRKGGRKVGRKCKKPTPQEPPPQALQPHAEGQLRRTAAPPGANSFGFTGRLRGRKLRPGRYVLVAQAGRRQGEQPEVPHRQIARRAPCPPSDRRAPAPERRLRRLLLSGQEPPPRRLPAVVVVQLRAVRQRRLARRPRRAAASAPAMHVTSSAPSATRASVARRVSAGSPQATSSSR